MTDAPKPGGHAPGLRPLPAALLVGAVMGASGLLGMRNAPAPVHPAIDRWYHKLRKPPFTPPDPVFGAVWPVLETGMAVGGYRLLRASPSGPRTAALGLWLGTTAMIGGWTEIFFRRRELGASTVAAVAMTGASAAYVATAARVDRPAAWAAVPLTLWLGFASLLADGIRRRNG